MLLKTQGYNPGGKGPCTLPHKIPAGNACTNSKDSTTGTPIGIQLLSTRRNASVTFFLLLVEMDSSRNGRADYREN